MEKEHHPRASSANRSTRHALSTTSPTRQHVGRPLALACGSAVLLIAAFPPWNQLWCAWIGLVPWLVLLGTGSSRQALGWSYVIGILFFLGTMWWLAHVTVVGLLILCAYLAMYFAAFGWMVVAARGAQAAIRDLFMVPAAWVMLEYIRSHALTGQSWNLLAHSQAAWTPVIQYAEWTGVWGVSFLIVLVNVALAGVVSTPRRARHPVRLLLVGVACLAAACAYGALRLPAVAGAAGPSMRIAVVQGNIPQEEKWDDAYRESILTRYEALTHDAAARQPALIVWPETSVPGYLGIDEALTQRLITLATSVRIPLLVGAPMGRVVRPGRAPSGPLLGQTNSAALIDADGTLTQRYDKLHLVPFGEFIPLERHAPWLRDALPPIGEFVPGRDATVFRLSAERLLGVLICFEDIFPELARRLVRRGARVLINITNDAWFGPTAAAYQHAQASTFRAVELRVPIVRAANTGWSGCIDRTGRWRGSVRDAEGRELFVAGTHTCEVSPAVSRTLYAHWGDWFAWVCAVLVGIGFLLVTRSSTSRYSSAQGGA